MAITAQLDKAEYSPGDTVLLTVVADAAERATLDPRAFTVTIEIAGEQDVAATGTVNRPGLPRRSGSPTPTAAPGSGSPTPTAAPGPRCPTTAPRRCSGPRPDLVSTVTVRVAGVTRTLDLAVRTRAMLGTTELAYDQLEAATGPMEVRRSYDGAMQNNVAFSKARVDLTAGRVPWISFSSAAVVQMRPFFASCVGKGEVWVTVAHEVDLGTKGLTAAQFRTLYADLARARDLEGATNVRLVVVLTAEPYRSGTYAPWMPDPAHVDVVAADAYRFWRPAGSPPDPKTKKPDAAGNLGPSRPMSWLVGALPAYAKSIGKPWALGEFGAHPDPQNAADRAEWLRETVAWCDAAGCAAAIYFHSGNGESGPWWLDRFHFPETPAGTDRQSLAAWRDLLTR